MKNVAYMLAIAAIQFPLRTLAQGCLDQEPRDPYCFLPMYLDKEIEASFDNVVAGTAVNAYQSIDWQGLVTQKPAAQAKVIPHSLPNYAVASAGHTDVHISSEYDYFYLSNLYFGCTATGKNGATVAQPCTLQMEGTCLPTGFPGYVGGELSTLSWTFHYKPGHKNATHLAKANPFAKTTFNGTTIKNRPVLCTNYTLSAKDHSGHYTSLVLDDVSYALYKQNEDF